MVLIMDIVDAYWPRVHDQFHNYLIATGRSPETARTYLGSLSIFRRWCSQQECDLLAAEPALLRMWVAERAKAVSSVQLHKDVASVRLFYHSLVEDNYREDNPASRLRIKRGKNAPTRPLHLLEIHALLRACRCERDRLIVLTLSFTGMRISELASLDAADIDWHAGLITVKGKGSKQRLIAPRQELFGRLHSFLSMFPAGPVWRSNNRRGSRPLSAHQIRKILYELAERAGLEDIHPHRFRSYFATEYLDQFADIQALQGVMGHESIETTAVYAEYTRAQRGRQQMRRFGRASDLMG